MKTSNHAIRFLERLEIPQGPKAEQRFSATAADPSRGSGAGVPLASRPTLGRAPGLGGRVESLEPLSPLTRAPLTRTFFFGPGEFWHDGEP
jgi:hypothetical protein